MNNISKLDNSLKIKLKEYSRVYNRHIGYLEVKKQVKKLTIDAHKAMLEELRPKAANELMSYETRQRWNAVQSNINRARTDIDNIDAQISKLRVELSGKYTAESAAAENAKIDHENYLKSITIK